MKKSLILSTLVLLISIIAFVGSTIAYFSDTGATANTFTSGNVQIKMNEAAVKIDGFGNIVADSTQPRIEGTVEGILRDGGKLFPGQSICKDPWVQNTGSEDAWIAIKVTLEDGSGDLRSLIGFNPDKSDLLDITMLLTGGLLNEVMYVGEWNGFSNVCYNDHYAMVQHADPLNDTYEFYFFMLDPFAHGEYVQVFEELYVMPEWDNEEMKQLSELKLDVRAYAVQTFGFSSCYEAMTTAFQSSFTLT